MFIVLIGLASIFFLFSYYSNNNSFPKHLSAEEEKKYLEEYEKGSEEAKNVLIERNLRLVAFIVKKYSNHSKENDDLISVGTIGLIKAITTYKNSKGTRLATYAARCIDNAMLTKWQQDMKRFAPIQNPANQFRKYLPLAAPPGFLSRARLPGQFSLAGIHC